MKRKRWRRYGIVVLLVVATGTLWLLSRPYPRLSTAVIARLYDRGNLTLVDVQESVKAPPGDYSSGYREYDTGNTGGFSHSALCREHQVQSEWVDPTRSPQDMAKLQAKMQRGKLCGWWGRHRVLVVEVDDDSHVVAISYRYCENRPKGWVAGLVWHIDTWIDGRN